MKKLLIVMTSLHNGGAERSLVNFLQELPPERYEVDLLLFKKEGTFLPQVPSYVHLLDAPEGLRRLYSPMHKSGRYFFIKGIGEVVSRRKTASVREKRAYRWIHFYSPHIQPLQKKYDVAVAYISEEAMSFVDEKVQATRKLVWVHNDYRSNGYPKAYDKPRFGRMDAIVTISPRCLAILQEEFPEYADKMVLLENISSSAVLKSRAEEFFPKEFSGEIPNLVSIGRLTAAKGFDLAIDAAALLVKQQVPFRWFILGTGELRQELEQRIRKVGVTQQVVLLGVRSNPYPYIKNSVLLVQSSRFEGKSVVLDEAKILGTPIVATAYPTVGDQVEDGREGVIVPMSAEGIADGIERMLTDKDAYQRVKDYLAQHEYDNRQEIEKYCRLLDGETI